MSHPPPPKPEALPAAPAAARLDARGLLCPLPILLAAREIAKLPARGRLVVEGELANDRMTLHAEAASRAEGLSEALAGSMRDITKLRCEVRLAEPGSLPNDGKLIEDLRRFD